MAYILGRYNKIVCVWQYGDSHILQTYKNKENYKWIKSNLFIHIDHVAIMMVLPIEWVSNYKLETKQRIIPAIHYDLTAIWKTSYSSQPKTHCTWHWRNSKADFTLEHHYPLPIPSPARNIWANKDSLGYSKTSYVSSKKKK